MIIYITHLFILFTCVYVCVGLSARATHVSRYQWRPEEGSEPLTLELHVVAGIWVPC